MTRVVRVLLVVVLTASATLAYAQSRRNPTPKQKPDLFYHEGVFCLDATHIESYIEISLRNEGFPPHVVVHVLNMMARRPVCADGKAAIRKPVAVVKKIRLLSLEVWIYRVTTSFGERYILLGRKFVDSRDI